MNIMRKNLVPRLKFFYSFINNLQITIHIIANIFRKTIETYFVNINLIFLEQNVS